MTSPLDTAFAHRLLLAHLQAATSIATTFQNLPPFTPQLPHQAHHPLTTTPPFPPKTSQTHSSSTATTAVFLTQPQSASRQRQTIHRVQTRTFSFTYAHFTTSVFTTPPQVQSDSPTQEQYRLPATAYTTNHNDFSHQFAQFTSTNITSSTESATFTTCITSTTIQASTPPHGFTTLSGQWRMGTQ